MTIAAILVDRSVKVIGASRGDTVRATVDLLAEHRIGAVPVLDGDQVVGIFQSAIWCGCWPPMVPNRSTGQLTR